MSSRCRCCCWLLSINAVFVGCRPSNIATTLSPKPYTDRHNFFRLWPGPLSNCLRIDRVSAWIEHTRARDRVSLSGKWLFYVRLLRLADRQTRRIEQLLLKCLSIIFGIFLLFFGVRSSSSFECGAFPMTRYAITNNYSALRCIRQVIVVVAFDSFIVFITYFFSSFIFISYVIYVRVRLCLCIGFSVRGERWSTLIILLHEREENECVRCFSGKQTAEERKKKKTEMTKYTRTVFPTLT